MDQVSYTYASSRKRARHLWEMGLRLFDAGTLDYFECKWTDDGMWRFGFRPKEEEFDDNPTDPMGFDMSDLPEEPE